MDAKWEGKLVSFLAVYRDAMIRTLTGLIIAGENCICTQMLRNTRRK